ncbi:MAG: response regulator transcription factor, partial [Bacteroidia bacterium]
ALFLSKREHEVLKYLLQGLSSQKIADKLFVSKHTINAHRRHILKKTNCHSTTELSRYALLNGFG